MRSKYKGRKVTYDQECRIVRMYKKERLIKDIAATVGLSRQIVTNVLDAHGIRKSYTPAEAKKKKAKIEKGTIIQQCAAELNERQKLLNKLSKPSKLA